MTEILGFAPIAIKRMMAVILIIGMGTFIFVLTTLLIRALRDPRAIEEKW